MIRPRSLSHPTAAAVIAVRHDRRGGTASSGIGRRKCSSEGSYPQPPDDAVVGAWPRILREAVPHNGCRRRPRVGDTRPAQGGEELQSAASRRDYPPAVFPGLAECRCPQVRNQERN